MPAPTASRRRRYLAAALLCASAAVSGTALHAATLQVSPVTLELAPDAPATGITLRNPGDRPIYGQVRIYRWTQEQGDDVLTPSQELAASPPLLQITGQSDQLVRLVRVSRNKLTRERSYRVLIDELPMPDSPVTSGITIRLRYSIPVFLMPETNAAPPKLTWNLVRSDTGWLLRVANEGDRHAQIAAVRLIDDAGRPYEITAGLLGYALAGSTRQWSLRADALDVVPRVRRVQATVNTQRIEAGIAAPGQRYTP